MSAINLAELRELMSFHRLYHSPFQIDNFITARAGLTDWGMFRQALREIAGRIDALKNLAAERGLAHVEVGRQDRVIESDRDKLDVAEARIKRGLAVLRVESLELNIRHTAEEMLRFFAQARALRTRLPDDLTPAELDRLDREFWCAVLQRRAALEFEADGRISYGTLEGIWSLPLKEREPVLRAVSDPGKLIEEAKLFVATPLDIEQLALPEGGTVALLEAVGA